MKNPLYPYVIINDTMNYSRCLVITLEKTHIHSIFSKDINDNYYEQIYENYQITSVPMHIIKMIPEYKQKFIMFNVKEDDLLLFNFKGKNLKNESIVYNLNEAILLIPNHTWTWFYQHINIFIRDGINDMYKYLSNYNEPLYTKINSLEIKSIMDTIPTSKDVTYWTDINKCQLIFWN